MTTMTFLAIVVSCAAVTVLVFVVVSFGVRRQFRILLDEVATRNACLTLALELILRQHDFMTPHPGETCADAGCLIAVDEARRLLTEDVLAALSDEADL